MPIIRVAQSLANSWLLRWLNSSQDTSMERRQFPEHSNGEASVIRAAKSINLSLNIRSAFCSADRHLVELLPLSVAGRLEFWVQPLRYSEFPSGLFRVPPCLQYRAESVVGLGGTRIDLHRLT
jgi:hypothetical protein